MKKKTSTKQFFPLSKLQAASSLLYSPLFKSYLSFTKNPWKLILHGKTKPIQFCLIFLSYNCPWPYLLLFLPCCWIQEIRGKFWTNFLYSSQFFIIEMWFNFCLEKGSEVWWEALLFAPKPSFRIRNSRLNLPFRRSGHRKLVHLQKV